MNAYNIWWIVLSAKNLKSQSKTQLKRMGFSKWLNKLYLKPCNSLKTAKEIEEQITFPHIAIFITDKQFSEITVKF